MKFLPSVVAVLSLSALSVCAEVVVIQDFEGDGFGTWQATGNAFGLGPVGAKLDGNKGEVRGYSGSSLASSARGGDTPTGTLSSPEITLSHPYLGFLIAGGSHPGKTAVQLLVGGQVVREAVGKNGLSMDQQVWDIAEFQGKKGVIRIVDQETGYWGVIFADHFVFSSEPKIAFPATTPSKVEASDKLVPVEGEGSAAVPSGVSFKVSAPHDSTAVTSPTAISFGNDGSVYVAETNRFHFGIEDDRENLHWYLEDLALRTTAERRAMHERWFHKRSLEWMTAKTEVVRHLSGEQADGTFSKFRVFDDKYNDLLDGTAGGVLAWDHTVYFACIPKLWMFHDPKGDGNLSERKVIEDGFGVRVSLSGHDMNGFVIGYDGRVWGTIGDRGFNLTTKEGRKYDFHNRGAVFRFEPDGTQFEVVHFGLRNPKELAFDEFGNGISVDNNSDQGDASRVVYVVEGADSGWEMEHQAMHTFHRQIGMEKRPPSRWMNERVWDLQNPLQPAFIVPPSAHITNGPSGLTYHPGAGFREAEARHFHICDYKGSAGASGIWSFKLEPSGAGMKMVESHKLLWGVAATDVEYDWKGRLVIADFIGGWSSHGGGRLLTLSADQVYKPDAAAQVSSLIREGFASRNSEELAKLLAHPDQRVRLRAQLELTRRPDAAARFETATKSADPLERVHGIWGLGILARRGAAIDPAAAWNQSPAPVAPVAERLAAARLLVPLLTHSDAEVRAQAVRVLEEAPIPGNDLPLGALILDVSPRVRSFAAIAAGRLKADKFLPEILTMLRENGDRDPILRHSGVFALERLCTTPQSLDALARDPDPSIRLATVIVLRRNRDASVSRFLSDESTVVADEAIRGIHDLSLEEGRPAVAALLDAREKREWTPFMLRRLIHSAFRVGGGQNAARVVKVASDGKVPEEVRSEALRLLAQWTEPFPVDQSTGHWAPLSKRELSEVVPSLNAGLHELLSGDSKTLQVALDLVEQYHLDTTELPDKTLAALAASKTLTGPARAKALEMLLSRKPAEGLSLASSYVSDEKDEVALVALKALGQLDAGKSLAELAKAVDSKSTLVRQGAWKILANLQADGVEAVFVAQLKSLEQAGGVSPAALELMDAAEVRAEPAVKAALESLRNALANGKDPISRWIPALEGGDAANGFALFQAHPGGQCMRCHQASTGSHAAGGEAGPNLAGVAKRGDRRYLLESIVASSAVVVAGYGTVNVDLVNDGALTATLLQEKPDFVDVEAAGKRWRISRKDIKAMSAPVSAMPVMEGLLKPAEVRDLVAWLATLDKGAEAKKSPAPEPLDISKIKPAATASHVDPAVMQLGRQQFAMCSACHGPNGEGGPLAPPLAGSDWVAGPVENLIRIQLRGLQGPITVSGKQYNPPAPMPAQAFQSDEQIAAVLTYVRNSFGNTGSAVQAEQVKALRSEVGKPPLSPEELKPTK